MPSQQILQAKNNEVEEIKTILKSYNAIGIASLKKVRSSQLQELKKKLSGKVNMKVFKNNLLKFALDSLNDNDLNKIEDYISGSNIYLFTNLNPFKLALLLEKGKIKTIAKTGDKAAMDITVPEGNTGQPPGPIISLLNSAGLPTRIQSGSVWVSKDTLVVKKGDVINERISGVLAKLGIKAVELGLAMRAVLDNGLMIPGDALNIDLEETKNNLITSYNEAFALSLEIAYPTSENTVILLQTAHQKAFILSLNAAIPNQTNIADLIKKAHTEMLSLKSLAEKSS
ncbi:MAG TPA: 50S ribosomal protein L10 [Candidatus Glassbacteria bacterium]|nr:50S ribosomal protein L10 [Candidatus Glassbacteria bacterium]